VPPTQTDGERVVVDGVEFARHFRTRRVLLSQDFSYPSGEGLLTLELVEEPDGEYAAHCRMYIMGQAQFCNSTRRKKRPTHLAARRCYDDLHAELMAHGYRPTTVRRR
jgi:hypothetical protein